MEGNVIWKYARRESERKRMIGKNAKRREERVKGNIKCKDKLSNIYLLLV